MTESNIKSMEDLRKLNDIAKEKKRQNNPNIIDDALDYVADSASIAMGLVALFGLGRSLFLPKREGTNNQKSEGDDGAAE